MAASPLSQPYTPKAACINFGMRDLVLDVSNHAKFQLDQFRVSEPQVDENRYLPLTGGIALTTVYALTCYTVRTMMTAAEDELSTDSTCKNSLSVICMRRASTLIAQHKKTSQG